MGHLQKICVSVQSLLRRHKKYPPFVALMNEDEDCIIVTTLKSLPFCCHADLLVMPLDELHSVVRILNARLPAALRVGTGSGRTAVEIRHDIETIVGYGKSAPGAMKVPFSIDPVARRQQGTPKTPASPLAVKRGHKEMDISMIGRPKSSYSKDENADRSEMVMDSLASRHRTAGRPSVVPSSYMAGTSMPTPKTIISRTQLNSSVSSCKSSGNRSQAVSSRVTPKRLDQSWSSSYKRGFSTATRSFSTPERNSPRTPILKMSEMDILVSNMMSMSVSGPVTASISVGEFGMLA